MTEVYSKAFASIESVEEKDYGPNGGFTAVLSTPSEDRDGDELFRDEWKDFQFDRYTLDMDHGMSVAETVGSFVPYFDGEKMMMDAYFSSIPRAQEVRTLVDEGHIRTVSVAFMVDKTKKSGTPRRELLNAGIVAIPSNRDAVILASKAASALKDALSDQTEGDVPDEVIKAVREALGVNTEVSAGDAETKSPQPYGDVRYADPADGKYPIDTVAHIRAALAYINVQKNYDALGDHAAHVKRAIESAARAHGINVADDGSKSVEDAETKDSKAKGGTVYIDVVPRLNEDALKNVLEAVIKATATASGSGGDGALVQAIHDAASHLGAGCPVVEVEVTDPGSGADDGANKELDQEAFTKALDETLTPEESPADESPAPDAKSAAADEDAAESKAAKRAREAEILAMRAQSLTV